MYHEIVDRVEYLNRGWESLSRDALMKSFWREWMAESEFRREFIPLFTFQCTVELLFFSEAIGKKPRKHNAEFSVGVKRKEATFCVAVLGKADVRQKYYHVRVKCCCLCVRKCVLSVLTVVKCHTFGERHGLAEGTMHRHFFTGTTATSCRQRSVNGDITIWMRQFYEEDHIRINR